MASQPPAGGRRVPDIRGSSLVGTAVTLEGHCPMGGGLCWMRTGCRSHWGCRLCARLAGLHEQPVRSTWLVAIEGPPRVFQAGGPLVLGYGVPPQRPFHSSFAQAGICLPAGVVVRMLSFPLFPSSARGVRGVVYWFIPSVGMH